MSRSRTPISARALRPLALAVAITGTTSAQGAVDAILEEIVVVAHPLSAENLTRPTAVLDGEALERNRAPSIGETVARLPGVHSANFGPAVGRPVINGLSGSRVRVLEDRIGSLDVSSASPDHAVMVEPAFAESVEVITGPATLLYGSGAIGGVVDVHTGRIPHRRKDKPLSGRVELRGDDVANQRAGTARVDGSVGAVGFHVDGFRRDLDDYDIPGFAESEALRALEAAEGEGEGEEEMEAFGTAPNTFFDARGGALGLSLIGDAGFIGFSTSVTDAQYGLPGGHAHEHEGEAHEDEEHEEEEGEGGAFLDLDQTRFDVEAGLVTPLPGFSSLNLRLTRNDYAHQEIEPSGEVGTRFENDAWEGRVELSHERVGAFEGVIGLQFLDRQYSATGEEAFVQPIDTRSYALFAVEDASLGDLQIEISGRIEQTEHTPTQGQDRRFTSGGVSVGLGLPIADSFSLSLLADASSRAPGAEELYSNGVHLATRAFELGDDRLQEEQALNLSATLAWENDRGRVTATLYGTRFRDYIFQRFTGVEEEGFPVLQWDQADADFAGLNLGAEYRVIQGDRGDVGVRLLFDRVAASLDVSGNDNLPRLPPMRHGVGLFAQRGAFSATLDYLRVDAQDDVPDFELPTGGYDDLRLSLDYRLPFGTTEAVAFVNARNLTNDEQREHTSYIKDFVPRPGRALEAGVRVVF